jgi:DNA topoisomerase-1
MTHALVIVESPGKIKKLQEILGKDYTIKASMGHVMEMDPSSMGIDFENNFEPINKIKPDRAKVVADLRDAVRNSGVVYLASDLDREGEAIADQLKDILHLKKYYRIRFNEITKAAILNAVKNPTTIDEKMVDAQKARRVLDRLVGYEISPLLQKTLRISKLSAGRVQSIGVRLVADKEKEINDFILNNSDSTFYKVAATFDPNLKSRLYQMAGKSAEAAKIPLLAVTKDSKDSKEENHYVIKFLSKCSKSEFRVGDVSEKISSRNPVAPFTTSSLQQEASKKLGFSLKRTMDTAQKLYEKGYITYMRTDSVDLSKDAIADIEKFVNKEYGKEYYHYNKYETKSKNAQEAHEAVRPTHIDLMDISDKVTETDEIKLYNLIWRRTVASQMAAAKIKITTIQITISYYLDKLKADPKTNPYYYFQSEFEKIVFMGYMKVYASSEDDTSSEIGVNSNYSGPPLIKGDVMKPLSIEARQEFLRPPARYDEAGLAKKLEQLDIGRPSTTPNIIGNIIKRDYIRKSDTPGIKKSVTHYKLNYKKSKPVEPIEAEESSIMLGHDTNKLIPTDLGKLVVTYLMKNFPDIMDYKFTAHMEDQLDEIANGKKVWHKVIRKFYDEFHPHVLELVTHQSTDANPVKVLGKDKDNNEIVATMARFGPVVRKTVDKKFMYAPIQDPLTLETITLADALKLFEYPKILGKYEKKDVLLQKGKFGYYIIYGSERLSIGDKSDLSLDEALKLIEDSNAKVLRELVVTDDGTKIKVAILNGPYGPYIQATNKTGKKTNHKITGDIAPSDLTEEQVLGFIKQKKVFKKPFAKTAKVPNIGDAKPAARTAIKSAVKPVVKPVVKPAIKSAIKPAIKPTTRRASKPTKSGEEKKMKKN